VRVEEPTERLWEGHLPQISDLYTGRGLRAAVEVLPWVLPAPVKGTGLVGGIGRIFRIGRVGSGKGITQVGEVVGQAPSGPGIDFNTHIRWGLEEAVEGWVGREVSASRLVALTRETQQLYGGSLREVCGGIKSISGDYGIPGSVLEKSERLLGLTK